MRLYARARTLKCCTAHAPTSVKTTMQFVLERVTSPGARVGRILWTNGHTQSMLDTPLCLPYTRAGAVPHLVQSVIQDLPRPPSAAMLTLPTLYELPGTDVMREYQHGIHRFLNLKVGNLRDHLLYLSIQDPHCPPRVGYNEEKSTSVWTNGGRMKVTVDGYVQFVKACRPNAFECLCDSASSEDSKLKRIVKSVDRTLRFLDEILTAKQDCEALEKCGLLGAVVGGDVVEERRRSAAETAKRPVDGFVLEGFDLSCNRDSLQSILQSCTELLPLGKARLTHGLCTPADIFTAVECGVDVFDSSYIYTATERGCALTYPNESPSDDKCALKEGDRESSPAGAANKELLPFEIDLNDSKHADDFSPVLRGCECYCCLHHTRAYVHHLLHTREILASTLLMMHNLTHHMKFFASLRDAIRSDSQNEYDQFKSVCVSCS